MVIKGDFKVYHVPYNTRTREIEIVYQAPH